MEILPNWDLWFVAISLAAFGLNACVHTLTVVLTGELGLAGFFLYIPSPYILFNTIPPCPQAGQGGEEMEVEEEEWKESIFHERLFVQRF